MKTILISILQGVEAKNILRTKIYSELLKDSNVRLVLLVKSEERASYYKAQFADARVSYEVLDDYKTRGLDLLFAYLKFYNLRTATTNLRRRMVHEEKKNHAGYFFGHLLNMVVSRKPVRKMVRALDYALVRNDSFEELFNKYKPSAVFLAHLFDDVEVNILREAKKRNIRSVGFINSWDKLTARNALRLLPEKMVVFNNIVKNEAVKYADLSQGDIVVTGLPQYDVYQNRKPISRKDFFAKKGLDENKKLIVYAPIGKAFSNSDWDVIDLIRQSISNGKIRNSQLLVRFQPNDFIDEEEIAKREGLIFDWPGTRFARKRGVDWDMTEEDIAHLHDTLSNMDLLVCYTSSMSVDASVTGKPIININFELNPGESLMKSPTHYYKMAHYSNAVATGGFKTADSKDALIKYINEYLSDPSIDEAGRKRLVFEQAWRVDGKAGERIARAILATI